MRIFATAIDPRDTSWLENQPTYRAYFFETSGASEEWQLANADSGHEAVDWVDDIAAGRDFVMYVEMPAPQGAGLVWPGGRDPNEP